MVREGTFRRDLYYRLNVIKIDLEPLRQRYADIEPLSHAFLQKYNARFGRSKVFAPSVISFFQQYDWPGNVRELMHLIERLVIVCDNDVISVSDIRANLNQEGADTPEVLPREKEEPMESETLTLKGAKHELEISMVRQAYERYPSSYKVAEELGISQAAVMKILKRHGYCLKNGALVKME